MKIAAMNASFAPKYMHLQGWSLEIGQNIKMCQTKTLKCDARTLPS